MKGWGVSVCTIALNVGLRSIFWPRDCNFTVEFCGFSSFLAKYPNYVTTPSNVYHGEITFSFFIIIFFNPILFGAICHWSFFLSTTCGCPLSASSCLWGFRDTLTSLLPTLVDDGKLDCKERALLLGARRQVSTSTISKLLRGHR